MCKKFNIWWNLEFWIRQEVQLSMWNNCVKSLVSVVSLQNPKKISILLLFQKSKKYLNFTFVSECWQHQPLPWVSFFLWQVWKEDFLNVCVIPLNTSSCSALCKRDEMHKHNRLMTSLLSIIWAGLCNGFPTSLPITDRRSYHP